ncbi:MAG: cytochrome c3 family protein [Desulfobia sp.]
MIKKTLILATAFAFLSGFAMAGSALAADEGPADITMKSERGIKPAILPHAMHQEKYECGACHHGEDEDGNQVAYHEGQEIPKCAACHNKDNMSGELASLMGATHKNCKGCHKKDAPDKNTCTVCHPPENQ